MRVAVLLALASAVIGSTSEVLAQEGTLSVRCEAFNARNKPIGIGVDFELDDAERLESVIYWQGDSTDVVLPEELSAPSHFFTEDRQGNLLVFGFKTFNDGLEEDTSVLYVRGKPSLSKLQLKDSNGKNFVTKKMSCRKLK